MVDVSYRRNQFLNRKVKTTECIISMRKTEIMAI